MSLSKQEIAPRFNKKLSNAINTYAQRYSLLNTDIRILISPKENLQGQTVLLYTVYNKNNKLCDAKFDDIVKLDMLESLAVNENKVAEYIINSLVKFSIGAVCEFWDLEVMIFTQNEKIKLGLVKLDKQLNQKKIINYFTVDKLF